ncbi:ShlB/FhaC/HecB family hemolysin secretion/activation protein [Plectonema cf. radiosum LEGE 06105]|uniref:ShlB/FhaC/HecB family hemolysin secretion/activation protein n=1 Tax=Plectonema cf. radiosum LEGE 06105 TaxID=945769 RepID=A0A8J7F0T9_9CYAN|nr:ShlB/FhaC/HecB family hemolysin secretion/activation protein [Plectonema radiosum]MBE9211473.1 ShlB/FhaC/HecB family hemolysin secretion/activation protein [Plectonema cf. radiosum LEGE 06105]
MYFKTLITKSILVSSLLLLSSPAIAQTPQDKPNPNLDRFPQPIPNPQPLPTEEPTISPPEVETIPEQDSNITIPVTKIEVTGNTLFNSDIENILKLNQNRNLTLTELRTIADAITKLYLQKGYITSRAVLADQEIKNGVVQIRVIEGSLEKIQVEGNRRLNSAYIRSRIKLGAKTPLNQIDIENQLRLLRVDPMLSNIEATLQPGNNLGESILVVKIEEAPQFNPFFGVDNYSSPSVGSERFGGGFNYRNLTGIGDEFTASYYRSTTGGSNVFDVNYQVPVNPKNGTIRLRYAPSDSKITAPEFADFDITSDSQLYEVSYRQPLTRTPSEEFALSLAFTLQNGQTFLGGTPTPFGEGPDSQGNSRTRIVKFGQDYIKRDLQGAWGLRSQFNLGLDIFDATVNSDSQPDGRFFSWLGQIQRVQRLSKKNLLIAQAELQLTPDSLLSNQQFFLGGGQSLRGYRQNARSGDNGFRVSLEDRITIVDGTAETSSLQLAPFIEMGAVWNHPDNPNQLSNQTFLSAAGLGLIVQPTANSFIRLDYAVPFINLDDKGNNAQDEGFFFSVGYNP